MEIVDLIAGWSQRRKMFVFGVMALGQFMALLDVQIVASSLNSIRAGLSAGPDEIDTMQTAYLTAEIVMIPLSGFLSQALSTRWLFTISAALFTVFSLMCGLAWDLRSMILFRTLQGFVGGAMVPTVFAAAFTLFTDKSQRLAAVTLGLVATLAPTLGPSLGGWLTELYGWRSVFFVNLLPGAAIATLIPLWGKIDEGQPRMLLHIDWAHVIGLAAFLGGMQYVLEEGPRRDWFDDPTISAATWLSVVGAVIFLERSLRSASPVVSLSALKRPTFAFACVLSFVAGFGIYAVAFLTPTFLSLVRDFSSLEIGTTVFVPGLFMIIGAPLAAGLMGRVDDRVIMGAGFALYAAALWMMSGIGENWGFAQLFWPQALRGVSVLLCIAPTVGIALGDLQGAQLGYASGLFNLTRNLGGSTGIALTNTWLQADARTHLLSLSEGLHDSPGAASAFVARMTHGLLGAVTDPAVALKMSEAALARLVGLQALTLGFDDVLRRTSWLFLIALLVVPFCRPYALGKDSDATD
jgi:DHA2 family multidrug resistance protein